ncbi:hypothetical protein M3Y97_00133600 [Aphelenchoides bicaudatus]|nr:hypothetical protein M3Y97_00133600 [Aphelenchoides bicaudatus]
MRLLLFALALCFLALQTYASPVNKVASKEANEQTQFGDIVDLNKEPEITTTSPAPSTTTPVNQTVGFVPFSEWHCGSGYFDKWFAHELIQADCPSRMVTTNDCCLQHDNCYTEQLSQQECDQVFCQCLDNALKPYRCGHLAGTFCG